MKPIAAKKSTASEKITAVCFFVLFLTIALLCTFPLIWAINNSLKTDFDFSEDSFSITESWEFANYADIFNGVFNYKNYDYFGMLFNSLWMVAVRVLVNVASSAMLAYAIAKFRFPGKDLLYVIVIFVNTIPVIGSGPAAFRLLHFFDMINKPWKLWLSWASGFDFAFIVLYGYFKGVSPSYSEAAYIDGAGEMRVFLSIVVPQVVPCLVAIMITQAIGVWNDYSTPMVYLSDMPNLALGLYEFERVVPSNRPLFLAAASVSAIPIITLYACTQNLIMTNMTAGGLKG